MKRTKFVTTALDVTPVAILPALFLTFNGYDLGTAAKKPAAPKKTTKGTK